MKKIYTFIFGVLLINTAVKAQITLTKAANEPVLGDLDNRQAMDTVNAIPNSSGAGQFWDFTSLITGTASAVANTYTTPSSVPEGTAHPTSTIARTDGTSPTFFKTGTSTFEMMGMTTFSVELNFTNTAVVGKWPLAFNDSNNDAVGGTLTSALGAGNFTGNVVITAPGTGTLAVPGRTFTNVLQVVTYMNINATLVLGTGTLNAITYQYYDASQKFPILTVTQSKLVSALLNFDDIRVDINNNIYAGINEYTLDNAFVIYPNPASNKVNIQLNKFNAATVEITNQLGQIVKSLQLESNNETIDISDLNSGIYFVKTTSENKTSVKKLIKD